jgi:hypothetical protein
MRNNPKLLMQMVPDGYDDVQEALKKQNAKRSKIHEKI